jgi:hypothetical protein
VNVGSDVGNVVGAGAPPVAQGARALPGSSPIFLVGNAVGGPMARKPEADAAKGTSDNLPPSALSANDGNM